MKSECLFELDRCGVSIEGKEILLPQTFSINENEFITISGRSGAGKSTLLQLLLGFLQPTTGRLFFKEKSMAVVNINYIREFIAVVFQEPVLMGTVVADAIYEPFNYKLNHRIKPSEELIEEWFEKFDLNIGLKTKLSSISGGEKQRIALIRALLMQRPILILDEITSALDVVHRALVMEVLRNSAKTVIVVSHDSTWIKNSPKNIILKVPDNNGDV